MSEQDNSDPGLTIGLNILEGVFWAVGSELGPIGNFLASFLSGMVSWWATNTPPNLNTTFASLLIRLQQTSLAVDSQLATYYQNVAANWDVQFTYNGQTQTLSNLANITVPAETDPTFETLAAAAIFALDQQVWTSVMQANYIIYALGIVERQYDHGREIERSAPSRGMKSRSSIPGPAYYNSWT